MRRSKRPHWVIREYKPGDATALLRLFRDTVRRINSSDYSEYQIQAWASDEMDPDVWASRLQGPAPGEFQDGKDFVVTKTNSKFARPRNAPERSDQNSEDEHRSFSQSR